MKLLLLAGFYSLGLAGCAFTRSGLNHAAHAREFPVWRERGAAGGESQQAVGLFSKQPRHNAGFILGKHGGCGGGGEEKAPGKEGRQRPCSQERIRQSVPQSMPSVITGVR